MLGQQLSPPHVLQGQISAGRKHHRTLQDKEQAHSPCHPSSPHFQSPNPSPDPQPTELQPNLSRIAWGTRRTMVIVNDPDEWDAIDGPELNMDSDDDSGQSVKETEDPKSTEKGKKKTRKVQRTEGMLDLYFLPSADNGPYIFYCSQMSGLHRELIWSVNTCSTQLFRPSFAQFVLVLSTYNIVSFL